MIDNKKQIYIMSNWQNPVINVFMSGLQKEEWFMKKNMKKVFGILLSTVLCMATLFGCGQNANATPDDDTVLRVGALKGPTTLGLLFLEDKVKNEETTINCEVSMMTAADEIMPLMVKGELDIALLPANVAGILYQKTQGGVSVIDINTLGVLYMVSGDDSIKEPTDLKGKTICLTGKGTTPDYVLHYILEKNGLEEGDYELSYKSEATEVAATLAENPDMIGLLPQPFATVACAQNDALHIIMDMNKEWDKVSAESSMVTGVTVVRNEFLEEHEELVKAFVEEHKMSAEGINADVEKGAALAVAAKIIPKEQVAMKAIPFCNITCITGEDMKKALSGYLEVLYEQNPEAVGGTLPEEAFYYIP